MKTPVPRRVMSTIEAEAARCLRTVRFVPGSWDKRFANFIIGTATISEKETVQLWRILKRYRRQWTSPNRSALLAEADRQEGLRVAKVAESFKLPNTLPLSEEQRMWLNRHLTKS